MANDYGGLFPDEPNRNSSVPSLLDMVSGRAGGAIGYEAAMGGRAPEVLDAAEAAAQGGTTLQGLAASFFPQYTGQDQGYKLPSDKGGFFNVEDLYRKLGRDIPRIGTHASNAPSTNNWRLLGMGPGWIMRNGQLIDTNSAGTAQGGPAGWSSGGGLSAEHFISGRGTTALGGGAGYGVPNMIQGGAGHPVSWGWPGAAQWNSIGATGMSSTY